MQLVTLYLIPFKKMVFKKLTIFQLQFYFLLIRKITTNTTLKLSQIKYDSK